MNSPSIKCGGWVSRIATIKVYNKLHYEVDEIEQVSQIGISVSMKRNVPKWKLLPCRGKWNILWSWLAQLPYGMFGRLIARLPIQQLHIPPAKVIELMWKDLIINSKDSFRVSRGHLVNVVKRGLVFIAKWNGTPFSLFLEKQLCVEHGNVWRINGCPRLH